jgi:hypothetical protein
VVAKGLNKSLGEQARDQVLHFGLALMTTVLTLGPLRPLVESEAMLSGVVVGLALGVTREITEGGRVTTDGSIMDMCFWILGGLAGGYLMGG